MGIIHIIQGPNLNLLGQREPDIYGSTTLEDIHQALTLKAKPSGHPLCFFQSNHEGELVDHIQSLLQVQELKGVIINPAAFTHTSVAIADALTLLKAPIVEVHLSNIYQRESFRHHSFVAPIARGQISGLGWQGYLLALEFLLQD